jgi:hypothetical protein
MPHRYEIHALIGDDFHDTHHTVRGTYRECMKELRSRKYLGEKLRIVHKEVIGDRT